MWHGALTGVIRVHASLWRLDDLLVSLSSATKLQHCAGRRRPNVSRHVNWLGGARRCREAVNRPRVAAAIRCLHLGEHAQLGGDPGVQAHALEAGVDARPHHFHIERLAQHVVGTDLQALHACNGGGRGVW